MPTPKQTLEGKCQTCGIKTLDETGNATDTVWVLSKIKKDDCPNEITGEWCNRCFKTIIKTR